MRRPSSLLYAIVDLETTGGRPDRDKITEIAIVLHNGKEVVDTYASLVNPGIAIPPMISRMTGITQEMVDEAPPFHAIAREIALRLEKSIFVAHNVRFDYQFLREAFSDLGFTLSRPQLCTVKLSRKAFPGLVSYSLGNLIRHFDIPVNARHRALDDALATARLLEHILEQDVDGFGHVPSTTQVRQLRPPAHLPEDLYERVPSGCGVYYFYNQNGDVIYVGKSKHIRKRLQEHLQAITRKAASLDRNIAHIDWILTGSELYAAILESYEIRRLMPSLNKAQRQRSFPAAIHQVATRGGYLRLVAGHRSEQLLPVAVYPTIRAARSALQAQIPKFNLCTHLTIEDAEGRPCFEHQLGTCAGACIGEEPSDAYNARVALASASLAQDLEGTFLLVDEGPDEEQLACILVVDGQFSAMGLMPNEGQMDFDTVADQLTPYPDHPEIRRLIRQYRLKHRIPCILKPD